MTKAVSTAAGAPGKKICEVPEQFALTSRAVAWSLDVFAGLLAAEGHADGAARLWGASDGLLESVGGSLVPTIGWIRDRYFEPTRTSVGGETFDTARAEGRAMPTVHAIALARQQALPLRTESNSP